MNKEKLISRFVAGASAFAVVSALSMSGAKAQTANSYITPQKPLAVAVTITSTVNVTLLNCSTNPCINGAIIEAINVVLNSTIAHVLGMYLCTTACPSSAQALGFFQVSSQSGSSANSAGSPPVNLLSTGFLGQTLPVDNNTNHFLFIPAGTFLTITDTQSTTSQPMTLTAIGASY